MKKIYALVCTAFVLAACGTQQQKSNEKLMNEETQNINIRSTDNSPNYDGTYKGIFPAADCPGIETTLILKKDKTFTLDSKYIDRNQSFNESGTYTLEDSLLTLIPNKGEEQYYKVEKNQLRRLNMDKKEITGELAENYILKKKYK